MTTTETVQRERFLGNRLVLQNMNLICTAEGLSSTKSSRIAELLADKLSPATSYTTHSENEKKCAEQLDEFCSSFLKKYPDLHERVSFLQPPNEYNVNKFACTAIQPTLLPNRELYDLNRCADFVAKFVNYEPLHETRVLVSPTQTISWAIGDAFDMSILLASLLIGAGYDAYVMVGKAPSYIRLKDQSHMQCSLTPKENNDNDLSKPWSVTVDVSDDCPTSKINDGLGLHFWVLVKPMKRDLEKACFVEASTGMVYPLDGAVPYSELWCAFNDKNYWVNPSTSASPTCDFSSWLQVLQNNAPFSYAASLDISPMQFALRYPPSGRKCLLLNKSKIEYFGDSIDPQGVATRVTQLEDDIIISQITELFAPNVRGDHLLERVRRPLDMSCVEKYSIKNPHFIKTRSETATSCTIEFHSRTRADGLVERIEKVGKSITEHFRGRSDSLIRRDVCLERLPQKTNRQHKGEVIKCGPGMSYAEIIRVDEHYEKPLKASAEEVTAAIRSFQLKEKQIVVTYHCRHEALQTQDVYAKDDLFQPDSKGHELLKLESSTLFSLKRIHEEMIELREDMNRYDLNLSSCFKAETDQEPVKSTDKEDKPLTDAEEEKVFDYLSLYLAQLDNPHNPLTRDEATQVRDACLRGLKERLMERANIMQSRLDSAREQLGHKQDAFQNKRTGRTLEEREAFDKEVAEDTFRIKVMEKRLSEHEDTAIERYKASQMTFSSSHFFDIEAYLWKCAFTSVTLFSGSGAEVG